MDYAAVTSNYLDDHVAEEYDRVRFSDPMGRLFDVLERRGLAAAMRFIRRENPAPHILDVPCGTGRITKLWLEQGLTVTGGDISPAMIRVAERKCAADADRVEFRQMDLEAPVHGESSFDVVSCIRLLHHLDAPDRLAVLSQLARLTRRFLIVNVPLSSALYRARRRLKRILRQGVSRTSVTWPQIQDETRQAGLRIVRARLMAPLLSENLILVLARTN